MSEFKGFPAGMRFTPVPNIVFSALFPVITDITELKVLLHVFEILYPKKGHCRFVTDNEMLSQANLLSSLKTAHRETLRNCLEALTRKGVLLHLVMDQGEKKENIYFIHTEANKLTIKKIQNGEMLLPGWESGHPAPVPVHQGEAPDIFTLYEQNIGMLTPLIADELREAEKQYPRTWIEDAIKEAVSLNKHNWKYIARILEGWLSEGKNDGAHRGHPKKNTDPDEYFRGKYGHMVH